MKILAIDTATQLCGVALLDTDSGRLARRQQVVTTHSESLLSLVTACLAELDLPVRDLSAVALGAGPGSFTGLRIGCATAKGLCYALSIPLCMVSSLLALAQPLCGSRSVLATQDAFRGQVYARLMPSPHASPGLRKLMEKQPALLTDAAWNPDELATLMMPFSGELLLVGGGALRYPVLSALPNVAIDPAVAPDPVVVARIGLSLVAEGKTAHLASALPTYVTVCAAEEHAAPIGEFSAGAGSVAWTR